jgi:2-hydroxy-3-keto-5-methylthiopentenyl-1-phosphate phosphatase
MITVSIKELVSAIEEADVFQFPSMSAGAEYIYNSLYGRLTRVEDVRLSEIDYNAFELDDIDTMRNLYSDVLEVNERRVDTLTSALRGIPPIVTAAAFV